MGVNPDGADDDALRKNVIGVYMRQKMRAEGTRMMQLGPDRNEPDARLWPFVALPQMAFIKGEKDVEDGTLYRRGLMAKAELDEIREPLAAGQEDEILL
jgi:murein tripeptide amidase MpaA